MLPAPPLQVNREYAATSMTAVVCGRNNPNTGERWQRPAGSRRKHNPLHCSDHTQPGHAEPFSQPGAPLYTAAALPMGATAKCPRRTQPASTRHPILPLLVAADTANPCALDGISNPDNVAFIPQLDTLLIAEDTENHENDVLWAHDIKTGGRYCGPTARTARVALLQ